jgi:AbrB family looped-hinge helix DNA binding protein
MSLAKVSPKGSVVIPKEIRKKIGLEVGMMVNVSEANGSVRIMPMPKDPIAAARGFLKGKSAKSLTDILLEERKADREREEGI